MKIDEFSNSPVSRERKWQLRKMAIGLCLVANCKEPITANGRCDKHRIALREYHRKYYKRKKRYYGAKSYLLVTSK